MLFIISLNRVPEGESDFDDRPVVEELCGRFIVAVDEDGEIGVADEEDRRQEGVDDDRARRLDHVVVDEAELLGDEDRREEVFRGEADGGELFELEDEGDGEDDEEDSKDDRSRGHHLHVASISFATLRVLDSNPVGPQPTSVHFTSKVTKPRLSVVHWATSPRLLLMCAMKNIMSTNAGIVVNNNKNFQEQNSNFFLQNQRPNFVVFLHE